MGVLCDYVNQRFLEVSCLNGLCKCTVLPVPLAPIMLAYTCVWGRRSLKLSYDQKYIQTIKRLESELGTIYRAAIQGYWHSSSYIVHLKARLT